MNTKVVLVTNMPVPYRAPVFDLLAEYYKEFHVIYCSVRESNRAWSVDVAGHRHTFLTERSKQKSDGYNYVHINGDIWRVLNEIKPSVVITTGFYPTQLIAFIWAISHFAKHIVMTDGWLGSEAHLSMLHKIVRRIVYRFTKSFIGASNGSLALFSTYGVATEKQFKSILPVVSGVSSELEQFVVAERPYDILFVGRLEEPKNVRLVLSACVQVELILKRKIQVRIVGDGSLADELNEFAVSNAISVKFESFVEPVEMYKVYRSAKILLLPTKIDAWGLVIAEAMAEGVVPIISNKTAAAGELVENARNGYVIEDFEGEPWAYKIAEVLNDVVTLNEFSNRAVHAVSYYNTEAAALGIKEAVDYAGR